MKLSVGPNITQYYILQIEMYGPAVSEPFAEEFLVNLSFWETMLYDRAVTCVLKVKRLF